jgi:hypothetical protein
MVEIMYQLEASLPLPGELAAERAAASLGQKGESALDELIAEISALEPDQQPTLRRPPVPREGGPPRGQTIP